MNTQTQSKTNISERLVITNMREIKFRGWNKQSHIMVDDIQVFTPRETISLNSCFDDYMVVLPLQYTGLRDKNGVEIYEGDIVDSFHEKWPKERPGDYRANGTPAREVKWITSQHHNGWNIYLGKKTQYEVIGNIYENPELLK